MIYLDHNATTPLHPDAFTAMTPYWAGPRGNPSSMHSLGRQARDAIEAARAEVARLIGAAHPDSVVFTSGGTEANVQALRGAFAVRDARRDTLAVGTTEHPAVLETARALAASGVRVIGLGVDRRGGLNAEAADGLGGLDERLRLLSVMAANNETGVRFDVAALAARAHDLGALYHCDAVQLLGKGAIDVAAWQVDLCTASAHKIGGPQGVGCLYIRPGVVLPALVTGGGQERGLRSGTENVAGIVGFGAAARAASDEAQLRWQRLADLRDRFETIVCAALGELVSPLVAGVDRLPNTSALAFPGVTGEALLMHLDACGVCVSTGSACSSGSGEPSHVLVAMGLPAAIISGALRISVGWDTTAADIETAAAALVDAVRRLARLSTEAAHV